MRLSSKPVALAASLLVALSAATLAQQSKSRVRPSATSPRPSAARPSAQTLVVDGHIKWILKSEVAALRPGVLESVWKAHARRLAD